MNASEAREYIKTFIEHTMPGSTHVELKDGVVYFDNMTDDQAVQIASGLIQIEKIAAIMTMKRSKPNA